MKFRSDAFVADSQTIITGLLRLIEAVVVVVAGIVAYFIRNDTFELETQYWIAIGAGALLMTNYGYLAGLYRVRDISRMAGQIGGVIGGWAVVMMALLAFAYLTKYSVNFSRVWAALWFVGSMFGFILVRALLGYQLMRLARRGAMTFNVVIIGAGEQGQRLVRYLKSQKKSGVRLLGLFDDRTTRVPDEIDGYKVLGTVDDLLRFIRDTRVDEIVIALPWRAGQHMLELLQKLKTVACDVKLAPEVLGFELPNLGYGDVAGMPMLKVFERPLSGWNTFLKLLEDRVLGLILLIVFTPLMLIIAAAIKLTSAGPVFFQQPRYGFNNNEFTVLKFRTMTQEASQDRSAPQARRNDPRITPLGAFLRRTSLDELPQLINVVRGEMSLVGPRPHPVKQNEHFALLVDDYLGRHRVKPGMTGWAQVNGLRGETLTAEDMRARVQLDIYYIENWSLLFDLKILIMTLFVGFVHKNAY